MSSIIKLYYFCHHCEKPGSTSDRVTYKKNSMLRNVDHHNTRNKCRIRAKLNTKWEKCTKDHPLCLEYLSCTSGYTQEFNIFTQTQIYKDSQQDTSKNTNNNNNNNDNIDNDFDMNSTNSPSVNNNLEDNTSLISDNEFDSDYLKDLGINIDPFLGANDNSDDSDLCEPPNKRRRLNDTITGNDTNVENDANSLNDINNETDMISVTDSNINNIVFGDMDINPDNESLVNSSINVNESDIDDNKAIEPNIQNTLPPNLQAVM